MRTLEPVHADGASPHDLAVIVVSHDSSAWLSACLRSVADRAGGLRLDVVVVENGSSGATAELLQRDFPGTRLLVTENLGFAHANNTGLRTTSAPFVLYLNPDTELLSGTLAELVEQLEGRPSVGLVGVRQVTAEGRLWPTMRRFPTPTRLLFQALGSESFPIRARWLGERELDEGLYDREAVCDWVSGSFMLARREAIDAAGFMDERFFLYCEEPDLSLRMRQAGWSTVYLPSMTVLHHFTQAYSSPTLVAQEAFARRQYARKHLRPVRRAAATAALALGYGLRAVTPPLPREGERSALRRAANRRALSALLGRGPAPFAEPPPVAVRQARDRHRRG